MAKKRGAKQPGLQRNLRRGKSIVLSNGSTTITLELVRGCKIRIDAPPEWRIPREAEEIFSPEKC